jgi:hypothetical protein
MKTIFLVLTLSYSTIVCAESFNHLILRLNKHNLIESELDKSKSLLEKSKKAGSWGDPKLSISAMNVPRDSLSLDESMMTGITFGLSQQVSLTGKFGKLQESSEESSKSQLASTKQLKREYGRLVWSFGIEKEKLINELKILSENLTWVKSNLRVTKKLYVTGKVPQQAVLDIQIRQSELKAQIARNKFTQDSLKHQLTSLLSSEKVLDIDLKTIPWRHLDKWSQVTKDNDFKLVSLKHQLRASDLNLSAQTRSIIPDVTIGLSYTKRNDIDRLGDFVSASITIPIPTSSSSYADKEDAVFQKSSIERKYRDYTITKRHLLKKIENDISDTRNQLNIIQKQTLKYAKSSRDITAKSYSRGGADYVELLRSELQYQNQRVNEINLIAKLKNRKINYLFLKGDDLKVGSLK